MTRASPRVGDAPGVAAAEDPPMPHTGTDSAERVACGRAARSAVARSEHAEFPAPGARADPLVLLARQDRGRVPELLPVRYGRLAASPLAYFRGAALPMAADLAATPRTGLLVQACGDAHPGNFGLVAAPGRRLVPDLVDFDETLPAPWEWDVKRLTAGLEVTGRETGHPPAQRRRTALAAVEAYREAMHGFAGRTAHEIRHARPDPGPLRVVAGRRPAGRVRPGPLVPASRIGGDGDPATLADRLGSVLARYQRGLGPGRRELLAGYRLAEVARRVPDVGRIGTRCWLAALVGPGAPLVLQVKEAGSSVLQEYTGAAPGCAGRRVVTGQRRTQAVGDVFLGWARTNRFDGRERDFSVRRLPDGRAGTDVAAMTPNVLRAHARLCGWTLAKAHARTGDAVAIAAYLGFGPVFAEAVREFAVACADQNERDHAALRAGIRRGDVTAATR